MSTPPSLDTSTVYSVSEVNQLARAALESSLGVCAVVGEISNLARPASGHVYFSLKDTDAQLRCAFFRQRQRGLDFRPENGDEVIAIGRVSLYEPRGDYQLIVDRLQMAGSGALQKRFEALRARLDKEGLFAMDRKREPPALPRRIGVVTSPSGAAIRDVLKVLARRFPAIPVRIYPSAVQGDAAAGELAAAFARIGERADVDVVIVARGGGSLEDLWPFNEEAVVRAIAACPIPVISGVGHETDVTLADLVADVRAPTPSGAAEIAVPDWRTFVERSRRAERHLATGLARRLERYAQRLDVAVRSVAAHSPTQILKLRRERLAVLDLRLGNALTGRLRSAADRTSRANERLTAASPRRLLDERRASLIGCEARLPGLIDTALAARSRRLAIAAKTLDTVSPLATLGRGYALVTDPSTGQVLRDAADVASGQALAIRLARGRLRAIADGTDE
ncbi:MAG: exodeoxyribonuclease VII large subunit [Pseudomonadota bacterium]